MNILAHINASTQGNCRFPSTIPKHFDYKTPSDLLFRRDEQSVSRSSVFKLHDFDKSAQLTKLKAKARRG
jgi:hypothetical protein